MEHDAIVSPTRETSNAPAPKRWNPRWETYARSLGTTPEQLAKQPGANVGYINWIRERVAAFLKSRGWHAILSDQQHAEFTRWLRGELA